jgi:hypothetical protein
MRKLNKDSTAEDILAQREEFIEEHKLGSTKPCQFARVYPNAECTLVDLTVREQIDRRVWHIEPESLEPCISNDGYIVSINIIEPR